MRIFIAVARSGSFASAGHRIGMDATTIARRTRRLESTLKATLFIRSRRGLQLTAAGARLSEAGANVEAAMDAANEESAHSPMTGTVRISAPEGFAGSILAPALPKFINSRAGMNIELVTSPGYLSPTTREVDIAITSSAPHSSRLVIEKLADFELGLYASAAYLRRSGTPKSRQDLRHHSFIAFVDDLLYSQDVQFLDIIEPKLPRHLSCSSVRVQMIMVQAGGGLGAFPRFMADDSDLVPVMPEITLLRTFWGAYHRELYDTSRIRTVRRWLIGLAGESARRLMPTSAA